MFRKLILFGFVLLIFSSLGYTESYVPKVGEVLEYKTYVKSIFHGANETVQVLSKDVLNGREVYHILYEMKSVGLVKSLFGYYQKEELVMDAEGMYPWSSKLVTREGKDCQEEEVSFDYNRGVAVRMHSKNGGPVERSEVSLPGFVQDQVSLRFFFRQGQFQVCQNKLFFYSNGNVEETNFKVTKGTKELQLESGNYSKYIQITDDVSNITVLVSETPERLPLLIKKIASFGSIEVKLVKIR